MPARARSSSPDQKPSATSLAAAAELAGPIMFANSGAPGMVLVIVRGDRTLVRGYGETERGNGRTPDGTTLLRIGSITKVFTTEVLVSLAAEGKLALTDPLRRFAGGAEVLAFGTRPITLLDLATYSAALPREIDGDPPEGATYLAWPTRDARWVHPRPGRDRSLPLPAARGRRAWRRASAPARGEDAGAERRRGHRRPWPGVSVVPA